MLHGHVLSTTSEADLVHIGSINVGDHFASLPYPYYFRCGDETEIPASIAKMVPSGYYVWSTEGINLETSIDTSGKFVTLRVDMEDKVS